MVDEMVDGEMKIEMVDDEGRGEMRNEMMVG